MSLGSIAHLQYYFARTGLLDGKGGQLAKPRKHDAGMVDLGLGKVSGSTPMRSASLPVYLRDRTSFGVEVADSPIEERDWEEQEQVMLPPTVSTYSHRIQHLPPPPDTEALRKELQEALEQARQALRETQVHQTASGDQCEGPEDETIQANNITCSTSSESASSQAWYELQGIHLLDIITLAIRSAKIYYTAHDHLERLTAIKPERKIREELLMVLDVLKRMAARNFVGGLKVEERTAIERWILQVEELLQQEHDRERLERQERESWPWLKGDWSNREREREWLFLNSSGPSTDRLPPWDPPSQVETLPTPFLLAFQSGLLLVRLHNSLVKKSKKHLGEIKTFHTDTAKPYRCAENLRYWVKAAEIRWELKLKINVTGIVHGQSDTVWQDFDAAILTWCRVVREELTKEWTAAVSEKSSFQDNAWVPPQLRFELEEPGLPF